MDAQRCSRKRDALLISREGLFDVKLFEFLERFIEKDVAVEHVFDHSFEARADLHLVSPESSESGVCRVWRVNTPDSWTPDLEIFSGNQFVSFQIAFGRRFSDFARQLWARRLLVPVNALQVIANILFVEGRL